MRYVVIIEKGTESYGAYIPDLPGCVAVGETIDEVRREIQQAARFHVEGMLKDGDPIPASASIADHIELDLTQPV